MSYVAAFRAYEWDESIAMLAARFFAACPGGRHVVLMNEERGPVDVGGHEKVSHACDFSHLDLPERPVGRSLWYNGDYAYVHLRHALPDYDHYLIVESDVSVNLSLAPMMRDVADRAIDLVVHALRPCLPSWRWFDGAQAQPDPHCAGLFAIVASGRALDAVLAERQALARRETTAWPIVESFVPTTVRNAGMRIGEIGDYAGTELLHAGPALSLCDPAVYRPGTVVHPVLGTKALARRLLGENSPADYDRPGSSLYGALRFGGLPTVVSDLWTSFERSGDHHGLARLRRDMRERGLPPPPEADLAWCKPAVISSVCEYSSVDDREREAAGANGWVYHEICAFHTAEEADAWWMVDLMDGYHVGRMEIVNRADFGERFRHFAIETGWNGLDWTIRYVKQDDSPVSGDADHPWCLRFAEPVACRFLRIRRLGPPGFLHLRRVRVFEFEPATVAPAALLAEAAHG